ncbi:hypothetical protein AOLI_G00285230 [Acnodon oligacanthus]
MSFPALWISGGPSREQERTERKGGLLLKNGVCVIPGAAWGMPCSSLVYFWPEKDGAASQWGLLEKPRFTLSHAFVLPCSTNAI